MELTCCVLCYIESVSEEENRNQRHPTHGKRKDHQCPLHTVSGIKHRFRIPGRECTSTANSDSIAEEEKCFTTDVKQREIESWPPVPSTALHIYRLFRSVPKSRHSVSVNRDSHFTHPSSGMPCRKGGRNINGQGVLVLTFLQLSFDVSATAKLRASTSTSLITCDSSSVVTCMSILKFHSGLATVLFNISLLIHPRLYSYPS